MFPARSPQLYAALSLRATQRPVFLSSIRASHLSTKARPILNFSDKVRAALEQGQPVVALESTIISHGMPYPANFETAKAVENVVRDNGATPATIAILDGQIQIGLDEDQIEHLAKLGRGAVKASRRDLAVVMSKKQTGATTVSATMILAHRAGISVFATGGIGGVHRGYEDSLDASADLTELGRTPVAVVCAGAKSILDIGRTLEFLETQGVTVATYGPSADFPAFFTRKSGFKSMLSISNPMEAAELIAANQAIDLQSGIVFGVPIPEEYAMDDVLVGKAIDLAVKESCEQNIVGKESTPFLLKRVNELTGGNSLVSNIALVKQNAAVAAHIARDLSSLKNRTQYRSFSTSARRMDRSHVSHSQRGPIMVIGGTVVDITSTASRSTLTPKEMLNSSHLGTTRVSLGGVGRNVAEAISHLNNGECIFVSAIGGHHGSHASEARDAADDMFAQWLMGEMGRRGLDTREMHPIEGCRTATYTAIHDATGNLLSAIADMEVFEKLSPHALKDAISRHRPRTICFDANISVESMKTIVETCRGQDTLTFFEPTSVAKCTRALDDSMAAALKDGLLHCASPNEYELHEMASRARELGSEPSEPTELDPQSLTCGENGQSLLAQGKTEHKRLLQDALTLSQFIPNLFIKLGSKGAVVFQRVGLNEHGQAGLLMAKWEAYPAHQVTNIQSVTGAGDSMVASVVTSLHTLENVHTNILRSKSAQFWDKMSHIIHDAQAAAILTMQTHETVSPELANSRQAGAFTKRIL